MTNGHTSHSHGIRIVAAFNRVRHRDRPIEADWQRGHTSTPGTGGSLSIVSGSPSADA